MAAPYSQQASAGAEYSFAKNLSVRADYTFARGTKLARTVNVNLLPPSRSDGSKCGKHSASRILQPQQIGWTVFSSSRLNPQFNDIYQIEDSASSGYNGVAFTLNRRMNDELAFSASYTVSKTIDDASDFDEQPQNPYALADEYALSRQNQLQRFRVQRPLGIGG